MSLGCRRPEGRATTGYLHPEYAQSHSEFGRLRELPLCGGWILERDVPGTPHRDAMGCYPLFACRDWSKLHLDLAALGDELVSLTLVADPFGDYDEDDLKRGFPDLVVPFKQHHVVDLEKPRHQVVSKHHRYYARKALREVSVDVHPDPPAFLDEWMELHRHLVAKHDIRGVKAFSRRAFAAQLSTPGIVLLRATFASKPIAAMMFFVQGDVAYAHVLGCTDDGYERGALYAILGFAIEHFTGVVRWCDVMGVPGVEDDGDDGVRQFKRGWSRETRTAWLCGRILNRPRYDELVEATGTSGVDYFPAYRSGELT